MTNTEMRMTQVLNALPEYKRVIRFLNNETMLQALSVVMPEYKDESFNITRRCFYMAVAMGLVSEAEICK